LIFLIKRTKPKKKLKKKKAQPKAVISFLQKNSRNNITIRLMSAYLNRSTEKKNIRRLGDAILYLVLAGKESFLYKKKLSMYEKILEKKKFY